MIKIFVSSVFGEPQVQTMRDIIQKLVLPRLNEIATHRADFFIIEDLRWGISTYEDKKISDEKILSVCLDKMRDSDFYIVILAGKLGTPVDMKLVRATLQKNNLSEFENSIPLSVTMFEILYGLKLERTLFYFDNATDKDRDTQETLLFKRKLRDDGAYIREYSLQTPSEDIAQMIVEDIVRLCHKFVWSANLSVSNFQRELNSLESFALQNSLKFSSFDDFLRNCKANLFEKNMLSFALIGETGSGKSTLMSKLAVDLKHTGVEVLPIFCGFSAQLVNAVDVVNWIIYFIEERLGMTRTEITYDELIFRLAEAVKNWEEQSSKTLLILVDGVDQLADDEFRNELRFIPDNLSAKVRLVFSYSSSFVLQQNIHTESMPPLAKQDKQKILAGILSFYGKELASDVIEVLTCKPASGNPLYLSLLIRRLLMMDADDFAWIRTQVHISPMRAINLRQIFLIGNCAENLENLAVQILKIVIDENQKFIQVALEYIAISRYGLRESDLSTLVEAKHLQWRASEWAIFIRYFREFFVERERDGCIDFTHKVFRSGLRQLIDKETSFQLHRDILEHFRHISSDDVLRIEESAYYAVIAGDLFVFNNHLFTKLTFYEQDIATLNKIAKSIFDAVQENGIDTLFNAFYIMTDVCADWNTLDFEKDFESNNLSDYDWHSWRATLTETLTPLKNSSPTQLGKIFKISAKQATKLQRTLPQFFETQNDKDAVVLIMPFVTSKEILKASPEYFLKIVHFMLKFVIPLFTIDTPQKENRKYLCYILMCALMTIFSLRIEKDPLKSISDKELLIDLIDCMLKCGEAFRIMSTDEDNLNALESYCYSIKFLRLVNMAVYNFIEYPDTLAKEIVPLVRELVEDHEFLEVVLHSYIVATYHCVLLAEAYADKLDSDKLDELFKDTYFDESFLCDDHFDGLFVQARDFGNNVVVLEGETLSNAVLIADLYATMAVYKFFRREPNRHFQTYLQISEQCVDRALNFKCADVFDVYHVYDKYINIFLFTDADKALKYSDLALRLAQQKYLAEKNFLSWKNLATSMGKKFQALLAAYDSSNYFVIRAFAEQMLDFTENLLTQSKNDSVAELLIGQYIIVGGFFLGYDKSMKALACFKRALKLFTEVRHRQSNLDAISAKTAAMENLDDTDDFWRFIPPYTGIFLHVEALLYNQICRAVTQCSRRSRTPNRTATIQRLMDKYVTLKFQCDEIEQFENVAEKFAELRVALNFLPDEDKAKITGFTKLSYDLQASSTFDFYATNLDELKSKLSYEAEHTLFLFYKVYFEKLPTWFVE